MERYAWALGILCIVGLASPAFACRGTTVLFTDSFNDADSSWGDANPRVVEGDGKLKLVPPKGQGYTQLNRGLVFNDADVCISVRMANTKAPVQIAHGLVFWAADDSNFYSFYISPLGTAMIARQVAGRWLAPVPWRKADGIKTRPGDINLLRITMSGSVATAYVNDQKFATIKGQPPAGGSQIGVSAESEPGVEDEWDFYNLQITNAPPPTGALVNSQ